MRNERAKTGWLPDCQQGRSSANSIHARCCVCSRPELARSRHCGCRSSAWPEVEVLRTRSEGPQEPAGEAAFDPQRTPCGQKTGRHPRSAPKHADLPGVRMPRYSFHVCNSERVTYQDEVSHQLADAENAKSHAPLLAREFAEDNSWQGSHRRPWH